MRCEKNKKNINRITIIISICISILITTIITVITLLSSPSNNKRCNENNRKQNKYYAGLLNKKKDHLFNLLDGDLKRE